VRSRPGRDGNQSAPLSGGFVEVYGAPQGTGFYGVSFHKDNGLYGNDSRKLSCTEAVTGTFFPNRNTFLLSASQDWNQFVSYPHEIEEYLLERVCRVTPFLRGKDFHGTRCHTGHLFFVVKPDGKCFRCFDLPFSLNYLGSVDSVLLNLYDRAEPCPGSACTCLRPALFGMICYGSSSSTIYQAKHQCRAFLPALRRALADRGRRLSTLARKVARPVMR
jgi:hypothetical protein